MCYLILLIVLSYGLLHTFFYLLFQFDNILMEESAQILEIETFIPLLLQVREIVYDLTLFFFHVLYINSSGQRHLFN